MTEQAPPKFDIQQTPAGPMATPRSPRGASLVGAIVCTKSGFYRKPQSYIRLMHPREEGAFFWTWGPSYCWLGEDDTIVGSFEMNEDSDGDREMVELWFLANFPLVPDDTDQFQEGWLAPDGAFYACGWQEHQAYAYRLCEQLDYDGPMGEYVLEGLGWVKITPHGLAGKEDYQLTAPQLESLLELIVTAAPATAKDTRGCIERHVDAVTRETLPWK